MTSARTNGPELEPSLDELQRESEARRAELLAIAADLPATTSRTGMLRALVADLRHAPHKGRILGRALRKLARAPRALVRRIRGH